VRYIQEKCS